VNSDATVAKTLQKGSETVRLWWIYGGKYPPKYENLDENCGFYPESIAKID
jgi:hypothetical protein